MLLALITLFWSCGPGTPDAPQDVWTEIRTVVPPKREAADYWATYSYELQLKFHANLRSLYVAERSYLEHDRELEAFLKKFVSRFGTAEEPTARAAREDFVWFLASAPFVYGNLNSRPTDQILGRPHVSFSRRVCLLTAKFQVEEFLRNRNSLDRFTRLTVWHGRPITDFGIQIGRIQQRLEWGSDDFYWYARIFMVYAYLTGQEAMLNDVKPQELRQAFEQWYSWLERNGSKLILDTRENGTPVLRVGDKVSSRRFYELPYVTLAIPFPQWKFPKPLEPRRYHRELFKVFLFNRGDAFERSTSGGIF